MTMMVWSWARSMGLASGLVSCRRNVCSDARRVCFLSVKPRPDGSCHTSRHTGALLGVLQVYSSFVRPRRRLQATGCLDGDLSRKASANSQWDIGRL